jgi:2,6-dihydroxypyridine 3-monooxygenase
VAWLCLFRSGAGLGSDASGSAIVPDTLMSGLASIAARLKFSASRSSELNKRSERAVPAKQHRAEKRVAVVGGSIGGLTAALLLRDAGWEVDVFERSAALLEGRGGGIVLHPATARYLTERAGVTAAEISVSPRWLRYVDRSGGIAHQERCRYRFTSYDSLYRRLLESFGRDSYHLTEECIGVEDPHGSPCLEFASGRVARTDLIVFADGINSFGRRLLAPGVDPRYAGYVAWRGTVREDQVEPAAFNAVADAITYHILPAGHVISYPIPRPESAPGSGRLRLQNWLWYWNVREGPELDDLLTGDDGTRFTTSVARGLVSRDRVGELYRRAEASLPPVLAEILIGTPEPFIQTIVDVAAERIMWGRACLIGDAASTARPHVAVGTAKAADDAWTLASALDGAGEDVAQALLTWSRQRIALGAATVARSREAGTRLQSGRWHVGEPLPYGLYRVGDSSFSDD